MKNLILTFLLLTVISNINTAQNKIILSPNVGIFVYNSENDTYILGDETLRLYWGFGLSYRYIQILGYPAEISYTFTSVKSPGALEFIRTDEGGNYLGSYSGKYYLRSNYFDLNLQETSGPITYGIGPTIGIINRGYKIALPSTGAEIVKKEVNEDLLSFAVGINALINFEFPLNTAETISLLVGAKLRYTHSLFYDKQGRNLDNYNQDFICIQLFTGIGVNL